MAFKFNAMLNFNSSDAVKGMAQVSRGWKEMKDGAEKFGKGLNGLKDATKSLTMVTAPLTATLGIGVKQAADFEKEMSLVQAELMATKDQVKPLTDAIRLMGATGKDTKDATTAALAYADANFQVAEIISALPPTFALMKAAQLDSATASKILTENTKAFNLEAKDTAMVADTLALTSTLTFTSVQELSEGMLAASEFSDRLGFSFAQTASAVGVLSETGIKGAAAGGALKNMFNSLSSPGKETIKLFGGSAKAIDQAVFTVVNGKKQFKDMEVIMANMSKVVSKAPDPLKAVAAAADIFGIKGTKAFDSFQKQLLETTVVGADNIDKLRAGVVASGEDMTLTIGQTIPKLVALRLQIAGAKGAADELGGITSDNVRSDFDKLLKIFKNLNRETGNLVLEAIGPLVRQATKAAEVLSVGFAVATGATDELTAKTMLAGNSFAGFLGQAIEFSKGFIEGFKEVKASVIDTFNTFRNLLTPIMGATGMTTAEFGKLAAKIFFIGAMIAPVAATIFGALATITTAVKTVVSVVQLASGAWSILTGMWTVAAGAVTTLAAVIGAPVWVVIAAIGAAVAMFVIFRKEIWQSMTESFKAITGIFLNPSKEAFLEFGKFVFDIFAAIPRMLFSVMKGMLNGLAKLLGDGLLSKIGLSKESISNFLSMGPGNVALDRTFGIKPTEVPKIQENTSMTADAARVAVESSKQQSLVQPPSAKEIANETSQFSSSAGGGGQQSMNIGITGELKTKISGNDLNIILANAQVRQSEKNGRFIDPNDKRKMMQNGMQAFGQ